MFEPITGDRPKLSYHAERCPTPHCGGSLLLEWNSDRYIKKCFLCSRWWELDDSRPAPLTDKTHSYAKRWGRSNQ